MTGRMFPFITETWNPLGGKCGFDCRYCWAKSLTNKYQMKKYQGEWYIDQKQMNRQFKSSDFVFVQDMNDIAFCPDQFFPILIEKMKSNDARYLFLTKNPDFYKHWWHHLDFNCILGATIETNYDFDGSKAPQPSTRMDDMLAFDESIGTNLQFVSIEPIMDFDLDIFSADLLDLKPWGVAIGYDNYNNHLVEPTLAKTRKLISILKDNNIPVFEKTLREAYTSLEGN